MVYSNIEPTNIFIDSVQKGIATILVRWNKTNVDKQTPDGKTYQEWQYDEKRMEWTLPTEYSSIEVIQTYLDSIYDSGDVASGNILSWAKASRVSF